MISVAQEAIKMRRPLFKSAYHTLIILFLWFSLQSEFIKSQDTGDNQGKNSVSAMHLNLGLALNLGLKTVISGTPILMEVSISNRSASKAERIRNRIKRYKRDNRRKKRIERWESRLTGLTDKTVTLTSEKLTPKEWFVFEKKTESRFVPLSWQLELLNTPEKRKIILGKDTVFLQFYLPPQESRKITPGNYQIRVRLKPHLARELEKGLNSPLSQIVVIDEKEATDEIKKDSFYLAGIYYLKKNDPTRAREAAKKMINLDSTSINGYLLLGEAMEKQGQIKEAYDIYMKATQIFSEKYPDKEPTSELIIRTSRLREIIVKQHTK
jgi:tetratricopeptide (TPR) repeat protein